MERKKNVRTCLVIVFKNCFCPEKQQEGNLKERFGPVWFMFFKMQRTPKSCSLKTLLFFQYSVFFLIFFRKIKKKN